MFKFVRKHSQSIGDHPLADTRLLHIAWKYKPSQPIGDHPLRPCPLWVADNFVRHSYIYIQTHADMEVKMGNTSIKNADLPIQMVTRPLII